MMACLKAAGNVPLLREMFMILVIRGRSSCAHCFRSQAGIGSSSQDLFAHNFMFLKTSSSVVGLSSDSSVMFCS